MFSRRRVNNGKFRQAEMLSGETDAPLKLMGPPHPTPQTSKFGLGPATVRAKSNNDSKSNSADVEWTVET
jgi:hypothetical protein